MKQRKNFKRCIPFLSLSLSLCIQSLQYNIQIQGGRFTPEYKKSLELPKDKTPIATVTFKNTGEGHIQLEYYEAKDENSAKKVLVRANHMLMLNFLLNATMYITLTKDRFHKNTRCAI